jgi:glycosyltransferase involved in cell wall biosynthesis
MEKLLTVVVPVYKVEQYINTCLESLIVPKKQMERLEVLVINDGTPDNSAIMAREFEKKFPQTFRVIDKENGGHGSCCNIGLNEAHGKYLHFLDSDDWFDKDFSHYLARLEHENADVVFTKHVNEYVEDKKSTIHQFNIEYEKTYDASSFDFKKVGPFFFSLHECSYRTELLRENEIHFREKVSYDDTMLRMAALPNLKTFSLYDMTLYHYLLGRVGQTMDRAVFIKKFDVFFENVKDLFTFYRENQKDFSDNVEIFARYILASYVTWVYKDLWNYNFDDRKNRIKKYNQFILADENYCLVQSLKAVQLYKKLPFSIAYQIHKLKMQH